MSVAIEDKQFRLDWLKWLVSALVLGGAIYANLYFGAESVLYRALGMIVAVAVAGAIAAQTAKGAALISLGIGARTELRKVVWPTKQERNQTTLIVVAVILLMSLILWGIDSLLSWGAAQIMG